MEIFNPESGRNEIWDEIFFLFLRLSQPDWDRNNVEMVFFNFLNFFLFFWKFSIPGLVGMEFEKNFFSLFLGVSQPVLDRNIAEMTFFFFAILFGISWPGSSWNGIRKEIFFFLSFSAYLCPVWIEILPE